jgi:hypothetical protein
MNTQPPRIIGIHPMRLRAPNLIGKALKSQSAMWKGSETAKNQAKATPSSDNTMFFARVIADIVISWRQTVSAGGTQSHQGRRNTIVPNDG